MYARNTKSWIKHLDFMILDILCLHAAFLLAYMMRHGWANPYSIEIYGAAAIVYTLADIAVLLMCSTLKNVLKRGRYTELLCTLRNVFMVTMTVAAYLFTVQHAEDYSRMAFYMTALLYFVLSYLVRCFWKKLLQTKRGHLCTSVYIVTTSDCAEFVIERFRENNLGQYLIQGICLLDRQAVGQRICGIPVTAAREDLLQYLCDKWVDEVFVSIPTGSEYPKTLIDAMAEMGIVVHVQLEQMEVEEWQHQVIEKVAGFTVRTLSMTLATPGELLLKRALDILGGLVGCVLTALLTVVIGPLIYFQSPGPIFFTQTRIGRNGKTFRMYKFRSMYMDAEERKAELMKENRVVNGLMFKVDYDPRIIGCEKRPDGTIKKGIGNFIRDWSLDEFPQFLNVLKGDLSLCGTRPPTLDEWEKYELHHRGRLAIKPGITGLWQVSGRSDITDFEEVVELDKKYIREWSMKLDLRILLKTVLVVLGRKGSM